jgi:polysaccharide pyruvyl transferase WcaK-like protein
METNFTFRGCGSSTVEKLSSDLLALFRMPPEKRVEAGAFGRDTVLKYYSMERMADDAINLYNEVMDSPLPLRLAKRYPADIVISGYYGYNNSGDVFVLQSIIENMRAYKPDLSITVLSMKPRETKAQYNVNAIYRFNLFMVFMKLKKAGLLITGGGNLIQDETSTRSLLYYLWIINASMKLGVRNVLYSSGIGPLLRQKNIDRARRALDRMDLITLREGESLQTLKNMNIKAKNVHITSDAVFALAAADGEKAKKYLESIGVTGKFFCISLRGWINNPPGMEQEIAMFADYICLC